MGLTSQHTQELTERNSQHKETERERDMKFDLLNNPHPHPLIFYQNGKPNQNVCCSKCHLPWRPPAFACLHCNFLIHQSCIHLPSEIHTPFHPHHQTPLSLTTNDDPCNCCGQMPYGDVYQCPECSFQIDIQCVIAADTKASSIRQLTKTGEFRHFSHPHPLILVQDQQRGTKSVACLLCQFYIESGSTYFCPLCDSHFHSKCAEMPREILNLDYHHHPLFLFFISCVQNILCDNCRDECIGFFYGCAQCTFSLHLHCLSSFKHQHNFKHFKKLDHKCQVCGKVGNGVDWCCSICNLLAHEECTELSLSLQTSQHNNPSEGTYQDDPNNEINLKNEILHFCHEHELTLYPFEDNRHCNGCMQCISTQSYGCPPCGFYLHEECARLPIQYKNSFLHSHELSMVCIPNFVFSCAVCLQYCHGFGYHCEECHYTVDIRCVELIFPFTHPSHHHSLSHFHFENGKGINCSGCGRNKVVFGCDDCKYYLDASCAHLPLAVRNRFDEHPLSLTFVDNIQGDECYCDICEEERDESKWFYSCKLCRFAAHINCILGYYPFLKSVKFKGHQHPLSLVKKGKEGYSGCGECGDSCEGNLAFECEDLSCKFNVHAFGPCYNNQLTQNRIKFTMPSLRYRSVSLYLNPIQRKRSKPIVLGSHGGRGWNIRNERIIYAIKQFMVNQKRWVDNIQIQYEKNEISFWSTKHAQNGDFKSKEHKDVVRKVAMSLGQHGNVGGDRWDDGAFPSIKQVIITHGSCIDSIQVEYYDDNNGISIWSERRGGNGGHEDQVKLEYPNEYLISIYGSMTNLGGIYVIGSLTLESNKKIYGPYGGGVDGKRFWFPSSGAKIVGFHGRCGHYLDSIGVKVVPIHNHNS